MKQGTAFIILAVTMLIAMGGGAFLYKRAFQKDKLYFLISRMDLICSESKGITVSFDPFINVYSADSVLLKEDAEPADVFVGKDTITTLSLKVESAGVWIDVSNDARASFSELDAGTGKSVNRSFTLDEWKRKYNRHPQSTLLRKELLKFRIPSDTGITTIALQMKLSGNVDLSDTCKLR